MAVPEIEKLILKAVPYSRIRSSIILFAGK
jgi:hypothetical protein